jgi:hypothetical protein
MQTCCFQEQPAKHNTGLYKGTSKLKLFLCVPRRHLEAWRFSYILKLGSGGLGRGWVSGQLHGPASLPPGKDTRSPLNGRLDRSYSRPRCFEYKSTAPAQNRTMVPQTFSPYPSPYTDCTTLTSQLTLTNNFYKKCS